MASPLQDAPGINTSLTVRLHKIPSVTHKPAGEREVARLTDSGNSVPGCERSKLLTAERENRVRGEHETACPQLR